MTHRTFWKGETREVEKARKAREEERVKREARAKAAARDGYCRLRGAKFGRCSGKSEWNHLRRRSSTMRMAPEERHDPATSIMACTGHHGDLDQHRIFWEYKTEKRANGLMRFTGADDSKYAGVRYEE